MNIPHPYHRPDLNEEDEDASRRALERDLGRLLRTNDAILDIGANRGQFALEILGLAKDLAVFSFEPVPTAFEELQTLNRAGLTPLPLAVGAQDGEATLHVTKSDVGSSLLPPLPGQPSQWLTPSHTITVKTVRLDTFMKREGIGEVGLLKSDAQGYDLEVIRSAGMFLSPKVIRAILVELNFHPFYSSQCTPHALIEELALRGYRLAWLYPHRAHDEWLWWADALFIPAAGSAF